MNITVTKFVNASTCVNSTGQMINITNRPNCAVVYTQSGSINFTQNEKTITSCPGCPVFIPEGATYINFCTEDAESLMVNFNAETDAAEIIGLSSANISKLLPHFEVLFSLSVKNLAMPLSLSEKCLAMSEIYSLLHLLMGNNASLNETERLFDRATEYIIRSVSDPALTCSDVAQHLNISEVYLRRLFVRYAGIPTWKYIRRIRLEKAKQLLSDKTSVSVASQMTGFADVYSFSRAYKDYFGFPPSRT